MGRTLVIGAGGVSTVAVKKMAMNADVFTDIMLNILIRFIRRHPHRKRLESTPGSLDFFTNRQPN